MPRQRRFGGSSVAVPPAAVDGVLVRHTVAEGHWAEDLPPVPAGCTVTVSFGCEALADEHRDALELLGYRVVDASGTVAASRPGAADFLVGQQLIDEHPTYWRSLAAGAARAFHLSLGPAASVVADIVAAHARAARR